MPSPQLDEAEFRKRFLSQYIDPAFDPLREELDSIAGAAWDGYSNHRKAPRTHKAGPEFAGGEYALNGVDPQGALFGLVGPRRK
jgi:hypothetical protein